MKVRTDIRVDGMTCAACAGRVTVALEAVDAVIDARVNFASGRATVLHDGGTDDAGLRHAIEGAGYSAPERAEAHDEAEMRRASGLRRRLVTAVVIGAPIVAVSMLPPLRFDGWRWAALVASAVVIFGSGWGFHRAAVRNLRHRAATMDTLVSLGTTAAWVWSAVVLLGRCRPTATSTSRPAR